MKGLDGRHRWEVTERKDARITHTCRVCGRTATFELLIPDLVIAELATFLARPNPYRALFAGVR